jgi:hypothetical protein
MDGGSGIDFVRVGREIPEAEFGAALVQRVGLRLASLPLAVCQICLERVALVRMPKSSWRCNLPDTANRF